MNTPKIRFKGFTDDWEQRKLGEVVGIYDGVHQTPQYQDSGIMFLSVENITTLKSEKYISEEAFERDYKVYPEKGDILMTRIGDVGTTNVVQTKEKVAFYVSLALLKPKEINSYFLSNAMKTSVFQKGLRERTLVTAIPQKINKDEIGRVNVFITNNAEEQKKIGDYFTALDHLITLHQRKCDETKQLKKFMLQKMFPKNGEKNPKIRFEGFTDDWEQRKSGQIAPLRGGYAFKSNEYCSDGIPIVRISNILSDGSVGADFAYYDEQDTDEIYTLYDGAVVLAMSGATTGKVSVLCDEKGQKYYQNQRVGYFIPTDICDYKFVKTIMRSRLFADQLSAVLVAGAQPNVSSKEIDGFKFLIPQSKNEQKKIGEYFSTLDNLITLHQRKCEKLKELKKYMLHNTFIE